MTAMTEASHDTEGGAAGEGARDDWASRTEQAVLDAAVRHAPDLGWNASLVRRACADRGLSLGDQELLLPNGARDLAVLLSRRHDGPWRRWRR